MDKEFEEVGKLDADSEVTFCEFGCGVGNALLPLAKKYPKMKFLGFDFSKHAINCLLRHKEVEESGDRFQLTVADLVLDPIPQEFLKSAPHLGSLIFVLCAISPENHLGVMVKIFDFLRPGAVLFFRDYALYD